VFLLTGLLVALLLAGVVSGFASSQPDGLDAAARKGCTFDAQDHITGGDCLARREAENQTEDSPLAGYGIRGLDGPLSTGLAGVLGVLVTLGLGYGVFRLVRRRSTHVR
jgi:cobalt/nickel transport protein